MKPPPGITTIIFDFGMVISSFDVKQFLRNISSATGLPVAELPAILEKIRDLVVRYETGLFSTDEFFRSVLDRTGLRITKEAFSNAYNDIFTPIPENRDLIRRLKPHYKLGLLSNTSEWHYDHAIRTVDVFPLFDAVSLSFEVKALKPSESIYRDMLRKLSSLPEECVYIDDLAENAAAAAKTGMHAIHYLSPAQLSVSLARLGISA
jgi:HAD superfamily hydrolase (TIGR01509 family)